MALVPCPKCREEVHVPQLLNHLISVHHEPMLEAHRLAFEYTASDSDKKFVAEVLESEDFKEFMNELKKES